MQGKRVNKSRKYQKYTSQPGRRPIFLFFSSFFFPSSSILAKKITLDVSGNYNPWKFGNDRQIKHWLVQPELRYWLCERFNGSFFGLHGHYGEMNVSNLNIFGMGHDRYDGSLYGAGISYGYQWIISKRWSMEATVGVGYARLKYDKYARGDGGEKLGHNTRNYFGPTKIGLSFIYVIK